MPLGLPWASGSKRTQDWRSGRPGSSLFIPALLSGTGRFPSGGLSFLFYKNESIFFLDSHFAQQVSDSCARSGIHPCLSHEQQKRIACSERPTISAHGTASMSPADPLNPLASCSTEREWPQLLVRGWRQREREREKQQEKPHFKAHSSLAGNLCVG
jgi:hypothetical protein